MERTLKRLLPLVMAACISSALALHAQSGPPLPEGTGKAQFSRTCSECHGVEMIINMRMSEGGWAGVVDDMVSRGAQATTDEIALITKYLATNFGNESPAAAPKSAKVNVNTAGVKDLVSMLGIADRDAAAIVSYRDTNGSFADFSALRKVPGLDLKKLEEQKDRIDFSAAGSNKGK